MEHNADVPVSSSGQFRSRLSATASQRRLHAATREHSSLLTKAEVSNERLGDNQSYETSSNGIFSSFGKYRRLFQIIAVVCTISFTYDLLFGRLFGGNSAHKASLSPLDALSQPFRLSRIANLHNPAKFEPFVISPLESDELGLNVTACICIKAEQLQGATVYMVDWPGFVSLVVVYPDDMSSSAKRTFQRQLRSLSTSASTAQRIHVHLFSHPKHIEPPFNSLMNLARFYALTEIVLLVPVLSLLPAFSAHFSSAGTVLDSLDHSTVILVGVGDASNENGEFEGSSALLLKKANGPWCPERFLSMQETQWKQCLWRAWLFSLGDFQRIPLGRDAAVGLYKEKGAPVSLSQDHILERIDNLLIPNFRSETCIHVLRNLNALDQKEGGIGTPSPPRQWLAGACSQTFDIWGDIFV